MFDCGKITGHGKMLYRLGGHYEGEWIDSHYNGLGEQNDVTGKIYKGHFKNDQKHGKGVLNFVQ